MSDKSKKVAGRRLFSDGFLEMLVDFGNSSSFKDFSDTVRLGTLVFGLPPASGGLSSGDFCLLGVAGLGGKRAPV